MAVHLSIGRNPFGFLIVSLMVFFGAGPQAAEPAGQAVERADAPNAARAGVQAASRAGMLFENGAEIRIRKDAKVYITPGKIPENDRLLEAYDAERPEAGRARTLAGEAVAAPGSLGTALQARRFQARRFQARRFQEGGGQGDQAYSLADAMREAIWRKKTVVELRSLAAVKLKSPTTAVGGCAEGAEGTAKRGALWIGLGVSC